MSEIQFGMLGDFVSDISGGGTPSREESDYWDGAIPWASVKDLTSSNPSTTAESITQEGLSSSASRLIPAGTPIVATRMAVGRTAVFARDVAINQDLKAIFVNPCLLNSKYLFHFLLGNEELLASKGTGSTVKGIRLDDLLQLPIAVPPLPEQKKIAKVLSGIDCLLEKVNSLYSKQKILTRAISIDLMTCGIGQKNFIDCKQGKTPDDWSICTLGSIFSLTSGRSKPKNLLSSVPTSGSEIPVYGGNGITGYATDSLLDSPTVTIGRVGEYCGAVHLTPKQSWVTDNALYINKKVSEFDLKFMYYFLDFCDLSKLRKQGGQPLVSQKPIMELEVALPPIEEQRRIACAMDSIAKNFSDLQILNHKIQGLKMSISTDLLSGRKRVSI